jgi:hypothetical protein
MLKPEDYLDHYKYELWPILSNLEGERKRALNIVLFAKVFSALCSILFLVVILIHKELKLPVDPENARLIVWFFLTLVLFVPLCFLSSFFLRPRYDSNLKNGKKTGKGKYRLLFFIAVLLFILFLWFVEPLLRFILCNSRNTFIAISPFFIITFIVNVLISHSSPITEMNYYKLVKSEILSKIIRAHHPFFNYKAKSFVSPSLFFKSELFNAALITDFSGSDLFSGETGFGKFYFSLVELNVKTKYHRLGRFPLKKNDSFCGIVYVSDFGKKFSGKTFVYPDFARRTFGSLLGEAINKTSIFGKSKLVMLEDVEFEDEFAVYSTDQVEARYILNPTMIEKLKTLRESFNADMYFSFVDHKIYMMIDAGYDILRPKINDYLLSFGTFANAYKTIGTLVEFTYWLSPDTEAVG